MNMGKVRAQSHEGFSALWVRVEAMVRRHLGVKLFLSYVLVIAVGGMTLLWAGQWVAPPAFDRHMAQMAQAMRRMMSACGPMMRAAPDAPVPSLETDLFQNFRSALGEALLWASLAASAAAVVASWMVTRQIAAPIQAISQASRRIAEGNYQERVTVPGDLERGLLDELGELAWNFNRMAEQLAHIEEARRQWLADVSHEMRTPLTAIRAYVEGLMDGVLPAEARTYAQILNEVTRLQRFIDDLRELSRMEAGAFHLHREAVAPETLLDEAARRFAPAFREKGVTLYLRVANNLPRVWADKERILQVLSNLLDNALRYTPPGGTVTLRAERHDARTVRFVVQDTGQGIPREHLPHIFKRFYRVEPSRSRAHGGSGLGLTIARMLVEAHEGRIWAESPGPGQGSTFTFTLPVAEGHEPHARGGKAGKA